MRQVHHWNVSKMDAPPVGTAKYENELASKLSEGYNLSVTQIKRDGGKFRSSMPIAWASTYRSGDADLHHATFQTVAPTTLLQRPKNLIVTVHDLTPLVYASEIRDLSLRVQWMLTPIALKRADRIIAISEFTKREINRVTGIKMSKIDVVHQGVDHNRYYPHSIKSAREELDLDPGGTYILVVSSNLTHKRVEESEAILEEIRMEYPNAKLIKAGYGETLTGENIINTGWIPEKKMPLLYSAADVYLHPSEYEGFGLPVLESMACGTPIVARDVASIPEIVDDVYELVSHNASPQDFARRVFKLLNLSYPHDAAVERSNMFSWNKTARQTAKIYQKLI